MVILDDLIISKIRKLTLAATKQSKNKDTRLWATKDKDGNWLLSCASCLMIWGPGAADTKSQKLDDLLKEGFSCEHAEKFEDKEWSSVLLPNVARIVRAEKATFQSEEEKSVLECEAIPFEYSTGWTKVTAKQRAYYNTLYMEALSCITTGIPRYRIYLAGTNVEGKEQKWLIAYEGKQPIMVIANMVPDTVIQ